MDWLVLFLVAAAAIAIARIVYQVRRTATRRQDDWDSRMIERLRRSGADPFAPVEVDFFVAMPDRGKADELAARLTTEGFSTDVRPIEGSVEHPWSVHARKSMSLNVHGMREVSTRLSEWAVAAGGRYDGWAPGPGRPVDAPL